MRDRLQLGIIELRIVGDEAGRIGEGAAQHLIGRQGVDVGDVTLLAVAEFDAERVDQHEAAYAGGRAHRGLEGKPAAKGRADQRRIMQVEAFDQVEIEIGDVVDTAEPRRARRRVETGMARRDDPAMLRQPVEKRAVLCDIVAAMQKQQRRPGAGDQCLDRYPGDLDAFHSRSSHLFSAASPPPVLRFASDSFPRLRGRVGVGAISGMKLPINRRPGGSRDPPFHWRGLSNTASSSSICWRLQRLAARWVPAFAGMTDRWRDRAMGQFGIGQPVRRFEDKRLLCGNGRFQNDVNLPGQAHAYVLRSPHAHAAIRSVDLSTAQAAPGVLAIYTADDLTAAGMGRMGVPFANNRKRPDGLPMFWRAHLGLARERVRYVGEPVLFIVAESLAQAKDAAELADIDYDILPSVTDTADAAAGRHAVWEGCPDNISNLFESGNKAAAETAFAKAAQIVKRRYVISRVYAHFMEPRGAIGVWDPGEDRYTLYADVQYPHRVRQALATRIFKIPESRIRVIARE